MSNISYVIFIQFKYKAKPKKAIVKNPIVLFTNCRDFDGELKNLDLSINPDKPVSSLGIFKKIIRIKNKLINNQKIRNMIKFNSQFQKLV